MVWWGPRKGRTPPDHFPADRAARGGVDAEDLELLIEGGSGHDGRNAFGHHGFSRARRTDHEQVVRPGDGDLDGASQGLLAFDLGEIHSAFDGHRSSSKPRSAGSERGELGFTAQEPDGAVEGVHLANFHPFDQRSFVGRDGGQQKSALRELAGEAGHREGAPDRPGGAGEAEFPRDEPVVQAGGLQLSGGDQDAEGDGQIVERALLAQVARGEVDRGPGAGSVEAAVMQRRKNAVPGFLDGGVGQADQEQRNCYIILLVVTPTMPRKGLVAARC